MTDFPEEILCPNCGQPVRPEQIECPNCGTAIEGPLIEQILFTPQDRQKFARSVKAAKTALVQSAPDLQSGHAVVRLSEALQLFLEIAGEFEQSGDYQNALKTYRRAHVFAETHKAGDASISLTVQTLSLLIRRMEQMLELGLAPGNGQALPESKAPAASTMPVPIPAPLDARPEPLGTQVQSPLQPQPGMADRGMETALGVGGPKNLPAPAPVVKKKNKALVWVIVGISAFLVLCLVGVLFVYPPLTKSFGDVMATMSVQPTSGLSALQTPDSSPIPTGAFMPGNSSGPVLIRWSIGLGTGVEPSQVSIENEVADDFNNSHNNIRLVVETIPTDSAQDTLTTEFAASSGPDIVGPVGWLNSNKFGDVWLDLSPYMSGYDPSGISPSVINSFQTDFGTVGLPIAVYPSAIYYNPTLFYQSGVYAPPTSYGEQYTMPNGTKVDWTWDSLAEVARRLTLDASGRNATQAGFNKNQIVQYGFSFGWEGHPNYIGSFWQSGQILQGIPGNYTAVIPEGWQEAWQWVYDGMWGDQSFIPNNLVSVGADYSYGNVFASGKVAMLENPSWYLCCLSDLINAGGKFDFGVTPSYNGKIGGRVDTDSFRIWKGTQHPDEAWQVLQYLVDVGIQKLVVGTSTQIPAYSALPPRAGDQATWLATEKAAFPFVRNWDTLIAGLDYADSPPAEAYMPNINDAWMRLQNFGDQFTSSGSASPESLISTLEDDLTVIFNR